MIDTEAIFKYKKPDEAKLIHYGFKKSTEGFCISIPIMQMQFVMNVCILPGGAVKFKVIETEFNEEYDLVEVSNAQGGFVGDVRESCEKVLTEIADRCFDTDILKAEQTRRILNFIKDRFDVDPDFPWEKYPDYAVFRRADNNKWFAIIMTVDKSRIGAAGHGSIEIIDMKAAPEHVEKLLEQDDYYPAYHMNKKHWFTACLDGSVSDEELFWHMESSYESAS